MDGPLSVLHVNSTHSLLFFFPSVCLKGTYWLTQDAHQVVSHDEWLAARKTLLEQERKLTDSAAAASAALRTLPMEAVTKDYAFFPAAGGGGDGSPRSLADLFAGRRQLIVYHFMFTPGWEAGCAGCSFMGDHIPPLAHLRSRDTQFAAVSRADPAALRRHRARAGWDFPWYSTRGGDFSYDFHAARLGGDDDDDDDDSDQPGFSVFYRDDDDRVYHSYSTYERGLMPMLNTYLLLDMTPLGRQDGEFGECVFKRIYEYEE